MSGQEVQGMLVRIEATTAQLRQEMAKADATVAQVTGRIDRQLGSVDSAFDRAGKSAQSAGNMVRNALSGAVGGVGISALLAHAEAYTTIANRMKLVTSSAAEFTAAQNAVFEIAQRSGQPLGATAELYQRIAQNQKELKLTGQGVANIVETISKTMVISGASAQAADAALVQLGQAFASGTLRGEELNSVMEQAPALAQSIAKGMGVSVGALRALGSEGKLTADSVIKALQSQAGAVDQLFGKMQSTVGAGMTRLDNSTTAFIGRLDQATSVSSRLSGVLTSMSKSMDSLTNDGSSLSATVAQITSVAENLAYVIGARLVVSAGQAAVSFAASTKAAIEQAVALAASARAADAAVVAEAALAKQSLVTAESRQADAKAVFERAGAEVAAAEQKVAADRIRQASEVGNLQSVQAALVAERVLEEQRLRAQITDEGRKQSIARLIEIRQAETAIIRQVQAAEVALAQTTTATSAEIQAAYKSRSAAAGAYAETKIALDAATITSEKATAAAAATTRSMGAMAAAGGVLLNLLTGPVGMIAATALVASSFITFKSSADTATAALIDQNATIDDSIAKYQQLGDAQRTLQVSTWIERQSDALKSAGDALDEYALRGQEAFRQLGAGGVQSGEAFGKMVAEVRAGTRSLNSVTTWVKENNAVLPTYKTLLEQSAAAHQTLSKKASDFGTLLDKVGASTASVTTETGRLNAAQNASGQTDASKAAWDKYIEQLTKTRDLLGANAAAEAAYTAAKMGATPAQMAQAKLIADQTDTLKKYQEAIKESNTVEQARLKTQLVALYAAEDAQNAAAETQKKNLADTAKAAEDSATRQVNAMQRIIDQNVRVATGTDMPRQNLSGYSLLTNGGTPPVIQAPVAAPKASPLDRATSDIARLNETTEANKRVDKAANAAATALRNQAKALEELLAKSGISTKSANDMANAYLAGADNVRAITIQQQIEEELLKTGAGARDKVTAAVNALHDAEDRRDVSKNISQMKVEVDGILKQVTATLEGKDALEAYNIEKSVTLELAGKNIAVGSEEYKQLVATTKAQLDANKALEQANSVDGIVDRLSPQIKLLNDYTKEQDALNAAIDLGTSKTPIYQEALAKLGQEYELNRSKATLWGQMTEGAIDRIDEAFANAWGNIGSGANTLWDNLKTGFKQTLGEIAHMLTTKPLLASISNWLTGTDNGQGLSSVWGKLLGSATSSSSGGSSGGSMFGGLASMGKTLYSIYDAVTGVGSSVYSGYASGGFTGAIQGGASYYTNLLGNIGSTLSSGFTSLIGGQTLITGATAAGTAATTAALTGVTAEVALSTAATVGAEGITAASLSAAVAEGAASIGTNIGVAGATTAAASGGISAAISGALSSAAAMWPLAVVMGMYQSGKLYDAGVRPSMSEMQATGGDTALGKATMAPIALQSGFMELQDKITGSVVGGKLAAILSGSTLHQAVWGAVGKKLFGSGYETKDSGIALGVDDGVFDAQSFIQQKKKGGLISGSSKTRNIYGELDAATKDPLGAQYNEVALNAGALFKSLGVKLGEDALDGINVAWRNISTTDGSTPEWIQEQLDYFFAQVGDSAVQSINAATDAGLSGFSYAGLQTFVKNLQDVNGVLAHLNVGLFDSSVQGGYMAEQLALWAGGIEALSTAGAAYYDAFFTDVEKSNDTLSDVRGAFTALNMALPDSREGFRDMVSGIDKTTESGRQMLLTVLNMSSAADAAYKIIESRQASYYGAFYSEAENTARSLAAVTQEFKDVSVTLPETRAGYRELVEAASQDASAAGKKMYETLMSLNAEAASAYDILETKAKNAADATKALADSLAETLAGNVSAAMSAVQRAVSAEQKALTAAYNAQASSLNDMLQTAQTNVTDLTNVSSSLESALKSLNGTSDDSVKMLRSQAQATLQSALAVARSGGSLAGMTGLEDALSVISDNKTDLYASLEDFNREQGRNANVVAELNAVTGAQLTTEQRLLLTVQDQIDVAKNQYDAQMEGLNAQLDLAQAQVDKLNGIDNSVLSVKEAIAALGAAINAARANGVGGGNYTGTAGAPSASDLNSVYNSVLGRDVDPTGAAYWAGLLGSGAIKPADLAAAIKADAMKNGELPAYATGGLISGPGTGTSDSILARLSAGEFVMNAAAVRAYGPGLLSQMNALQLPGFAAGGAAELRYESPIRYSAPSSETDDDEAGSREEILLELRALTAAVKDQRDYQRQTTVNTGRTETHLDAIRTVGLKVLEN